MFSFCGIPGHNFHVCFCALSPLIRLHAHRGHGGGAEASGRSPRGPARLREQPASGGPTASGEAAHDPAPAEADGHQGRAALLQHQGAGQGAHAQTFPGDAGGQGLIGGRRVAPASATATAEGRVSDAESDLNQGCGCSGEGDAR